MGRRHGITLVEVLVVAAVICLLMGILLPSFSNARELARFTICATNLSNIQKSLVAYAVESRLRLPPFAFSNASGNIVLSGHWGGAGSDGYDELSILRVPVRFVNLGVLVYTGMLQRDSLLCPSSPTEILKSRESYFPYTRLFSTYCLRFPVSNELFVSAPNLHKGPLKPLDIYKALPGGSSISVAMANHYGVVGTEIVPQVRMDVRYRLDPAVSFARSQFDPARDAMLSDTFCEQDHVEPRPENARRPASAVRMKWCHGEKFNVLFGGGSVRKIADDGTIRGNSNPPDSSGRPRISDDKFYFATCAEKVWQYFDTSP
jgi:prepilin-type processing-associated H-X9-DG protein